MVDQIEFANEVLLSEKPDVGKIADKIFTKFRPERFPWLKPDRKSLDSCLRRAQGGVAEAQRDMGLRYLEGIGVKRDRRKAVTWLAKAAEQGDADACIQLGSPYGKDGKTCLDAKRGVEWLRRAADAGSVGAKVALADCLAAGRGVNRDVGEAIMLAARPAAEDGMPEACAVLGRCHLLWKNYDTAMSWLTKGAEGGSAEAMFTLGSCLVAGLGVKADFPKGVEWMFKAATQGHELAADGMKVLFNGMVKMHERKEEEREKAARDRLPPGMGVLGPQVAKPAPEPTPEEKRRKKEYDRRAREADEGGAEAQFAFGKELLDQGRKDEAVVWLARAAGRGHFQARLLLNPLLTVGDAAVPIETDGEGRPVGDWNRIPAIEYERLMKMQMRGGSMALEAAFVLSRQHTACMQFQMGRRQEAEARALADGDDPVKKLCTDIGPEADHLRGKDFGECLALAESGDPRACAVAGACLRSGLAGAEKDPAAGADWLRRASDGGVAMASEMLGLLLLEGDAADRDGGEGLRRLLMAADAGRTSAMLAAARCLYEGTGGVEKDEKRVFSLLERAALLGDIEAQYQLCLCHFHGIGTWQDMTAGLEWEMKAEISGHKLARRIADGPYLNVLNRFELLDVEFPEGGPNRGTPIPMFEIPLPWAPDDYILPPEKWRTREEIIRDDQKRLSEIRALKAAKKAGQAAPQDGAEKPDRLGGEFGPHDPDRFDVPVFRKLGWLDDLKPDKKDAEACFERATRGDARACAELGFRYREGIGVIRDSGEAFKWISRAAEKGDPDGQYLRGHWLSRDGDAMVECVPWLEKAAAQGHVPSMYALGTTFAGGLGVEKDEKLALEWFRKAADAGYPPAMQALATACVHGIGGTPRDEKKGLELLFEAAKLGLVEAMYVVGASLDGNADTPEERIAGQKWITMAASRGHEQAQAVLQRVIAERLSGAPKFDEDGNYVGDLPMPEEDDGRGRIQ